MTQSEIKQPTATYSREDVEKATLSLCTPGMLAAYKNESILLPRLMQEVAIVCFIEGMSDSTHPETIVLREGLRFLNETGTISDK